MNFFKLLAPIILLNISVIDKAFANCIVQPDSSLTITVQSCENINPNQTPQLVNYRGQTFGDRQKFLEKYYRGSLIISKQGGRYVYPSSKSNPCQQFKPGKAITKIVTDTCCDTGAWGKCIFGGSFLYDPGNKPINSFQ